MRDPKRIEKILRLLEESWLRSPDLRLGQLIFNLTHNVLNKNSDGDIEVTENSIYNIQDDDVQKFLEEIND